MIDWLGPLIWEGSHPRTFLDALWTYGKITPNKKHVRNGWKILYGIVVGKHWTSMKMSWAIGLENVWEQDRMPLYGSTTSPFPLTLYTSADLCPRDSKFIHKSKDGMTNIFSPPTILFFFFWQKFWENFFSLV